MPPTLRALPRARPPIPRLRVAASLLLSVLAAACTRSDAATPMATRPIPVDVAVIARHELAPPIVATGTLAGKEETALGFVVGGVIARIAADEGATVRAGQLLAELMPTPVAAEVTKAEQGRDKARRDLARVQALHADSIATTEQLQDATTALAVAEENVRLARFSAEHARIRAPSDGLVLRRLAEPHQVIAAGAPVLVVRSARRGVVMRLGLSDRDAARVRVGDTAVVTFDALPGETYAAVISQRASAASPGSGTYDTELTLEPRGATLASGLIGQAEIRPRALGTVPMLPLEALVEADGDSATIVVVATGATRGTRRRVQLGRVMGDLVVIAGGAAAGERVVVGGAAYLDDSTHIVERRAPLGRAR